ncbi:MAG: Trk system potassium transporter TrkA [Candidatus Marinimicrobia bacterium]|nr:Trk system potassium transporter TrkA [Candidatus Neomarinimicrobiota bacterium]
MKVVIIGAGEVGFHLAKGLSEENFDITCIDISAAKCKRASENLDVIVVQGDGASPQVLKEALVQDADIAIAVTRVDEVNLIASQIAHELGARKIVARLRNTEYSRKNSIIHPEKFGIDKIIHPEMAARREIVRLVMRTAASSVVDFEGGRLQLIGVRIENGCSLIGMNLIEVRQTKASFAFSTIAILRGQNTVIPHGDFIFEPGDICYFLVRRERVNDLFKMMGKRVLATKNIMILGGGKIGRDVARSLENEIDVRLVEQDKEKAQYLAVQLEKTLVLNGDGTDIEFLKSERVDEVDSFVAVTENEQTNLLSALLAKHLGARQTIIHVSKTEYIRVMKVIGLDAVVSKNMSTVNAILEYIKSGQRLSIINFEDIAVEALELSPAPNSKITKHELKDIKFPGASVVGAVNHHGHISIPSGDTQITEEDTVLVFAFPRFIHKVEKLFN